MEATDSLILEAQKRLEEKRALLKQTDPEQIGSVIMENEKITLQCIRCSTSHEIRNGSWLAEHPERFVCYPCEESERIRREQESKDKEKEIRIQKRLNISGIGERFIGMGFLRYKPENEDAEKVLHECIEFTRNFSSGNGTNLLLIGSPGTGKNMLAAIIGQSVIKKDFSSAHTTALRCVRRVKDSWKHNDVDEQDIIDRYTSPDLLVIDEVGVQFGSPTELLYLTEIINERYEKRKSTILISNLTVKQLEETIGARIMDRFYEDGSKTLVFNWPSYRRK